MIIKVIGCGNAFSKVNYNQSFLIIEEYEGKTRKMLVDAGSRVPLALDYHSISINDIDDLYISHQHADHIGALEEFAFMRYDWANRPRDNKDWEKLDKKRINLIGDSQLLKDTWNTSLKGGLQSMESFVAKLDTFYKPVPIKPNQKVKWQGWTLSLIQQMHVMSGSVIMNSFGVMLEKEGHQTVYIPTDSQHFSPIQIKEFYDQADIILQDCECAGVDVFNEKVVFTSGVHANFGQLAGFDSCNVTKLSSEVKNKMWLSHYQDFVSEDKDFMGKAVDWQEKAREYGFKGFLTLGQELEV